jgi:DNA-binding NtrC family response regulator
VIFKGIGDDESDVEIVNRSDDSAAAAPEVRDDAERPGRSRSEVVLFSEGARVSNARHHMVEIFRTGVRSDLVPSLRTYFDNFFTDRQAMLAWLDEDGRFQPIVSQWTGEVPKLPARTFDELGVAGRYAILRLGSRQLLIYPVSRGPLESHAYLVVESVENDLEDDQLLLAELSRMLAVHWDRVENSSSLYGPWEDATRRIVEEHLPGTSQAVRVLRDSVVHAARSTFPVLLCGRPGSGRMAVATLIASVHPTGELPVQVIQVAEGEDEAFRLDLFGTPSDRRSGASISERAKGSVVVIRDVHKLGPAMQRELASVITHDVETGYGPDVRWIVTTESDCMALVNDGALDATLYNLFQRHIMRIPALNQRREDLPLLVVRLLDTVGAEQDKEIRGIELETLNSLLEHPFEGEMTELLGELRRLVSATPEGEMVRGTVPAHAGRSSPSDATGVDEATTLSMLSHDDLKAVVPAVERMIIDRVLRRTMGNQSKAARILNLSRGALIAKIKEYEVPDYRYLRRSK